MQRGRGERQTAREQVGSDPAWRRVRAQGQERNRKKTKSEVMSAEERPASIQAIKMSHELPEDHPSELEGWCW